MGKVYDNHPYAQDVAVGNNTQPSSQNGSSSTTTTSNGKVVDADYQRQFDEKVKAEEEFNKQNPYLSVARFVQLLTDIASIFVPNPAFQGASVALGAAIDAFDPRVSLGQTFKNLGLGAIGLVNPLSKFARVISISSEILNIALPFSSITGSNCTPSSLPGTSNNQNPSEYCNIYLPVVASLPNTAFVISA